MYFPFILILLLTSSFTTSTPTNSFSGLHFFNVADVKEYEGIYSFQEDSPVRKYTITSKDNDLYGEADSYGANKLVKQAEADTFVSTSTYGSTIIFTRDGSTKKVTGLRLIIQGNTLQASRDK
ncbi:DUF3471 domain-containing protein [Rhodocytophaga rosea]|uniref:DUF3471 domain-containing protein n=2 Tax=Rhodocytophaga rosea TaxID=2704465 RepID=A0A6C0GWN7_9BACT|nr:DUF3471 domain-containing protein [Rhodocytophaga rosea]